ncbi:hypothetical protein B0T22DRAFT_443802 [Podospora appendiculata]|uniref:HIT-type domain-containing protein n=1 Tax=Podospora appendiculata TaxID=314037 RepID=A0AAE0X3J5_9PEZI|nr:hypothetical protein B0T22DRAFT_443802 [Podospora appendiculata]
MLREEDFVVKPEPESDGTMAEMSPESTPFPEATAVKQEAAATINPDPEAELPKPTIDTQHCDICAKGVGKYKCPRCPLRYCSVACNKIHKEKDPHPTIEPPSQQPPQPQQQQQQTPPSAPDPYTVLLDHHAELVRLYRKYPDLETELLRIQETTLPPSSAPNPSSLAFKMLQQQQQALGGSKQHTWSRDLGLRKGAAALRKARTDPGDKGDAVREFCDLVTYLLALGKTSGGGGGVDGGADPTSLVREEIAKEETAQIARLLKEEQEEQERGDYGR